MGRVMLSGQWVPIEQVETLASEPPEPEPEPADEDAEVEAS